MDLIKGELEAAKKLFNLEEVYEFSLNHKLEVIRGDDYQYMCSIDNELYGSSFTFLGALVFGIKQYYSNETKNSKTG